jgi:hypothetical protein
MPAVRALPHVKNFSVNKAAIAELQRGRLSPVGRDLEARALRVTRRMVQNASGRPGPNVRTNTLRSSISSRIGQDAQSLFAQVGPLGTRTVKRGYNYALILEGIFPRGGAPPDGAYPFIAKSLDGAK